MKKIYFWALVISIACIGCRTVPKNNGIEPAAYNCLQAGSISASAILSVYLDNGSVFLTKQLHNICRDSGRMLITTDITGTKTVFSASKSSDLSIIEGKKAFENSPLKVFNQEITGLITDILTPDYSNTALSSNSVNKYGQWYKTAYTDQYNNKFYWNIDTGKIDLVTSSHYIAKGYDYRKIDSLANPVPVTIELFNLSSGNCLGKKIIKIEYSSFATVENTSNFYQNK